MRHTIWLDNQSHIPGRLLLPLFALAKALSGCRHSTYVTVYEDERFDPRTSLEWLGGTFSHSPWTDYIDLWWPQMPLRLAVPFVFRNALHEFYHVRDFHERGRDAFRTTHTLGRYSGKHWTRILYDQPSEARARAFTRRTHRLVRWGRILIKPRQNAQVDL